MAKTKKMTLKALLASIRKELYAPYSVEKKTRNIQADVMQIRRLVTYYDELSEFQKEELKALVRDTISEEEIFELIPLIKEGVATLTVA